MSAWALRELHKTYRAGWLGGRSHPVLRGVSLVVEPGERVGLIGGSGSGKTTLVRCGLGLIAPDAGTVELLGSDTGRWRQRDWHRARRDAQLLFQDPRAMLHPSLPIGVVLEESARLHRPEEDSQRAAARALDEVGLGGRGDAWPHELSGGERRRAGIARLLLARPRLVVADEPTSGLDAASKAEILELLLERLGPECAVVVVSHDLAAVAWACHRLVVLDQGEVVERFDTDDLRARWRPRHAVTARLLAASGWTAPPGQAEGA